MRVCIFIHTYTITYILHIDIPRNLLLSVLDTYQVMIPSVSLSQSNSQSITPASNCFIYLSIYLAIYPSIHVSIFVSICLCSFTYLSIYLSRLSLHRFVHLYMHAYLLISLLMSISTTTYLYPCLHKFIPISRSICVYIFIFYIYIYTYIHMYIYHLYSLCSICRERELCIHIYI